MQFQRLLLKTNSYEILFTLFQHAEFTEFVSNFLQPSKNYKNQFDKQPETAGREPTLFGNFPIRTIFGRKIVPIRRLFRNCL